MVPVVRGEGAEVGSVPRVVERVAGVAGVAADLQLVVLALRVQLEAGVLGVPVTTSSMSSSSSSSSSSSNHISVSAKFENRSPVFGRV